jgi:hypothetical protein
MMLVGLVTRPDEMTHELADLRDAQGYQLLLLADVAPFAASRARRAVR